MFIGHTMYPGVEIYCDAGGSHWKSPPDIVATSDKPLVIDKIV